MRLEIRHLSKKYGSKVALDDLSYTFHPGVYGILGANGAGKSTLMNLLTDTIRRTEGDILFNGVDILALGAYYREKIGYMPQQQGYYGYFSVTMFLRYLADLKGIKKKEAMQQIEECLEKTNMYGERNRKMSELSGGMRQRVLLCQTLLGKPEILILDEPTSGLDPVERIRIRNLISEWSENRTILLATHLVSDLECIADQVLLMKDGRIQEAGTPYELMNQISGLVVEHHCTKQELSVYRERYPRGNVLQRPEGLFYLRVLEKGEIVEQGWQKAKVFGLEEVYLRYL